MIRQIQEIRELLGLQLQKDNTKRKTICHRALPKRCKTQHQRIIFPPKTLNLVDQESHVNENSKDQHRNEKVVEQIS